MHLHYAMLHDAEGYLQIGQLWQQMLYAQGSYLHG